MAVIIPIRTSITSPSRNPARAEAGTIPHDLKGWRPEQLWLSKGCWSGPAQQVMADAVATAVARVLEAETRVLPQHELLSVLRYCRREVAWLRLAARVLRGPSRTATADMRNLAACALFLASAQHGDLLAAVEFAAEATGHAVMLEAGVVPGDPALPPGMTTVARLASRMRRRGREVLAHRMNWPDLNTVGPCLERALAGDPLRGLSELTRAGGA